MSERRLLVIQILFCSQSVNNLLFVRESMKEGPIYKGHTAVICKNRHVSIIRENNS
jgi:hypothetical protein